MTSYITNIGVSTNPSEEKEMQNAGFSKISVPLNKNRDGNPAYIWFRKRFGAAPITRIQVSFNDEMSAGLSSAGYTKNFQNLNPDFERCVFLWYVRGTTNFDTPIVKLDVTNKPEDEVKKIKDGWNRVGYNLSGDDQFVYLWVKRAQQTFIHDLTATNSYDSDADLFRAGYIRIDETTNTIPGYQSTNFLWYRLTTDKESAITDVGVDTAPLQYHELHHAKYTRLRANLNEKTGGNEVTLWFKKDQGKPAVQNVLLLLNDSAVEPFKKAGITVSENINVTTVKFDKKNRYLCNLKSQ